MANILYYTRSDFIRAGESAGGMGTKTHAMREAWDLHTLEVADCIPTTPASGPQKTWLPPEEQETATPVAAKPYDVILIELMGLLEPRERLPERIEELRAYPAPKLVYGSDSEIFRWKGSELNLLKPIVTGWIANCEWQARYFRDFELPVLGVMFEPINTSLFRPSDETKEIIVAGGVVSPGKKAEFFIELFSELKSHQGSYKTAYIGAAGGWSKTYPVINLQLEKELKEVTDLFYGQLKPSVVAQRLGESAIGVLNPLYETCNRFGMEMMASGKPRICSAHICYDDTPFTARFDGVQQCVEVLSELTKDFTELPDKTLGSAMREYAVENYSYDATQDQLNNFLRMVL